MVKKSKRYLITSALPYVNTVKHLGNLVSSLLPADIYARYLRQRGEDVLAVCGTDDHGTPAEVSALEAGVPVEVFVEKMFKKQKKIYERFGLSYDLFSRTHTPENEEMTQHLFLNLYENGYITEKSIKTLFCEVCKRNLPDRYVKGTCPNCGYESARGDQCENCSKLLDAIELINPHCNICGKSEIEIKEAEHLFLDLSGLNDEIKKWVELHDNWPKTAQSIAKSWIKEGLVPRCISRNLEWGIPIPLEGYEDKVFYVWFDAPIGYISISVEWAKQQGNPDLWEKYWKDPDCYVINFLGKDNVPFHTITFPATLMGADKGFNLADYVKAFQWLNFEGQKFSSSKQIGIFTDTALDLYPADYWRYYVMKIAPERHDTDFLWTGFRDAVNSDLADILGNFVHRTLTFINNNFDGKVPEPLEFTKEDKEMLAVMEETYKRADKEMREFEFQRTLLTLIDFARDCNKYFQTKKPWIDLRNDDRASAGTTLNVCVQCCKGLAILLAPFIPFSAEKIHQFLNLEGSVHEQLWSSVIERVPEGHEITKEPKPLFEKIELEELEKLAEKWGGSSVKQEEKQKFSPKKNKKRKKSIKTKKKQQKKEEEAMTKDQISFKEFQKLDLRVGTIKKAEPVEGTDKLLKIQVDLGSEERQIVAGIAERYSTDELEDLQIILVVNLEPATIRGVKSNGMLLAVDADPEISILTPLREVPDGAKVR